MLRISNTQVYDLRESINACRNSMRISAPDYSEEDYNKSLERAIKLAKCDGGHNNFLCGIRVSFDVYYPQYWSMEAERYHFLDIVSSSSKMHRLCEMDLDEACNEYVSPLIKTHLRIFIDRYNQQPTKENWMKVISNCPMGLELFMRCSTNYLQLRTIYKQRKNHKLKDWHVFCDWIETLPFFEEFINF